MSYSDLPSIFAIGLVLAVLGGASKSVGQDEQVKPAEAISAPDPKPSAAVNQQSEIPREKRPCKQGEDDRQSDLCASWKAADAAKTAADIAERTYLLTNASVWISLLTLVAAGAAALFAKRAAEATLRAADQAADTAKSAEESLTLARDEQRAWIGFENWQMYLNADDAGSINAIFFAFRFRNYGKTPGLKCSIVVAEADNAVFYGDFKTRFFEGTTVVPPNGHIDRNLGFSPEQILGMKDKPFIIRAKLRYDCTTGGISDRITEMQFKIRYIGRSQLGDIKAGKIDQGNFELGVAGQNSSMT